MAKIKHKEEKITISVGPHRKSTSWKTKEVTWGALAERLSKTHRTAESIDEYKTATKDRQAEIKDVGGFVGGQVNGGRRKRGSISARQLLTLDLDFAPYDFWEDYTMLYSHSAVLYSTHKHAPDSPRYRLMMPLSREVFPEEYEAVARKLAGNLGIELFDPTTFQVERLMYWPSTSKDGEYIYEFKDGRWLDTDKILAEYIDWTDTSQWPRSSKDDQKIKKAIVAKQRIPSANPVIA